MKIKDTIWFTAAINKLIDMILEILTGIVILLFNATLLSTAITIILPLAIEYFFKNTISCRIFMVFAAVSLLTGTLELLVLAINKFCEAYVSFKKFKEYMKDAIE